MPCSTALVVNLYCASCTSSLLVNVFNKYFIISLSFLFLVNIPSSIALIASLYLGPSIDLLSNVNTVKS